MELRGKEIFFDLSDPPAEVQRARALRGLEAAIADNDMARMARELARLERAGFDARLGLSHVIAERNQRLEDGMTHAHAAAADWLMLADRAPSPAMRLAALLEPVGHLADDTLGAGEFPYAAGRAESDPHAFVVAIEMEDESTAVALVRGALCAGLTYDALRPAFGEAALAHYADFGHCAIYTFKTGQLVGRLESEATEPLLLALTRMLVRATREERLPEFRSYANALKAWDSTGREPARTDDFIGVSIDGALKRTLASCGRTVREVYDALMGAAAWNLLNFNRAFEQTADGVIADNIGWLDFTHALTFSNACRHICEQRPDLWPRALLQMALFVGRNRKYTNLDEDVMRWRVNNRESFLADEMLELYDHGIPEPIIACHRVKVLCALEDELAASPDAPWADEMCAAVNRYLNSPMKRHHGLRTATQALDFIAKES